MTDQDTTGTGATGQGAASNGTPEDRLAEEVGLPTKHDNFAPLPTPVPAPQAPSQRPAPAAPAPVPQVTSPAPAKTGNLNDDIAKILQGVKLPERPAAAAPKKQIENKAAMFDTLSGTPPAEAVPQAPAAPAPQAEKKPDIVTPVHTLKDDLQHVVKDQKMSVVRAASLEQDRRAHEKDFEEPPAPQSHRTRTILITVGALIILGGGALGAVYAVMQQKSAPAPQVRTSGILFAESSAPLSIDNQTSDDLKNALAAARTGVQGALGSITQIIPTTSTTSPDGTSTTRPATLSEFMQAIGANPSPELLRALSDQFFFGIHTVDKQAPLFVIPVTSYDHAFAGILAWEATMNKDLAPIFTPVPATTVDQNGLPVTRTFQDVVMRNYDVRALKDDSGNIVLYYSFPSQQVLIIAESPYTFAEVLSRLQAAREL
jgi:hypothetical protein